LELVELFSLVGRDLHEGGMVTSHGGNLSVRRGQRLIITRTGAMLGHLGEGDLIELSLDDEFHPQASRELPLHKAVYRNTQAGALVHAHPPYTIALSLSHAWIEPVDAEGAFVLPRVPVVEVENPIGSQELAQAVARALVNFPVMVVKGHGSFARGKDLLEAYHYTSVLEASSRILWLVGGITHPFS